MIAYTVTLMPYPTTLPKLVTPRKARLAYEYLVGTLKGFHDFIYNAEELPPHTSEVVLSFIKSLETLEFFLSGGAGYPYGRQALYTKSWTDKFLKGFCLNLETITLRDSEGSYLILSSYFTPFVSIDPYKSSKTVQDNARRIGLPVVVCDEVACRLKL